MHRNRLTFIVLVLFILLTACSCTANRTTPVTTTPNSSEPAPSTAETVETSPTDTKIEPVFDDYVYQYEDERDLAWEQDVVYFAQLLLGEKAVKGHPYLINQDVQVDDLANRRSMRVFFNPTLRDAFIEEVFSLINQIPELSDVEIIYEMQRIISILGDAHSMVSVPTGEIFPYAVEYLEHNGEMGLYCVRIPAEHKEVLYAKLDAINDIPIDQVIQLLTVYQSRENEYLAINRISSMLSTGQIMDKNALQAAGIMGLNDDTARFRFITQSGESIEIELEALSRGKEYNRVDFINKDVTTTYSLSYSMLGKQNYFFEYLPEQNALYIRFYQMYEEEEYRLDAFLLHIQEQLREVGGVDKLIIDVRNNPGGTSYMLDNLVAFLSQQEIGATYILINEGSFSASVVLPYKCQSSMENVTIVGTPAGQPANFLASSHTYDLLKHDITIAISYRYEECDPDFTGDALMPNILVYPSLSDFMQGKDTVLEEVLKTEE